MWKGVDAVFVDATGRSIGIVPRRRNEIFLHSANILPPACLLVSLSAKKHFATEHIPLLSPDS